MTDELLDRSHHNPVLTRRHWPYRVNSVMNPAAAIVDGETVLVVRVEDRRGFSHLSVARSADGETNWRIDDTPFLEPGNDAEEWGAEDPRVTWLEDEGCWVVAYTAYSARGTMVALARTSDFVTVERIRTVLGPDDKNAMLLPKRVDGSYVMYHRPTLRDHRPAVWCSRSTDLRHWSLDRPVMSTRVGNWWDCKRIGLGTPPIETEHGWLAFYHGVRETVAGDLYRAGAVLLDLQDPAVVTHRSREWVLTPEEPYELLGDAGNVVFPTGAIVLGDDLRLYYGAADTCVGMARGSLTAMTEYLLECPSE